MLAINLESEASRSVTSCLSLQRVALDVKCEQPSLDECTLSYLRRMCVVNSPPGHFLASHDRLTQTRRSLSTHFVSPASLHVFVQFKLVYMKFVGLFLSPKCHASWGPPAVS